ncbi:hypothetical protein PIB30_089606 [Stylosanthes scabra]|uniref:Uncharacterized protein n=1 Tax=Stylosanthes scabra TaxID=79078 RepID=A0ABU6UV63_9FABA|nr:hypothetical protein [Stylosanthes scabra]
MSTYLRQGTKRWPAIGDGAGAETGKRERIRRRDGSQDRLGFAPLWSEWICEWRLGADMRIHESDTRMSLANPQSDPILTSTNILSLEPWLILTAPKLAPRLSSKIPNPQKYYGVREKLYLLFIHHKIKVQRSLIDLNLDGRITPQLVLPEQKHNSYGEQWDPERQECVQSEKMLW